MAVDDLINELSKSDRSLTIFCGAGVSINSGIPSAIPLLTTILEKLGIDNEDMLNLVRANGTLAMPFEAFFETFLENSSEHQLLNIFQRGAPNTNHFFLLKCFASKIISDIYTTNFDLLIERAFEITKIKLKTFKKEKEFTEVENDTSICKLIKVHGSIDDIDSLRTTLSTISNRKLSLEREVIIERLFSYTPENKKVLIIGYSCSDIFDIIPKIEKIFQAKKEIFLIEHDTLLYKKEDVMIEEISYKENDNPFKKYQGRRIKVNTNAFVKWFWGKIDSDYKEKKTLDDSWVSDINNWLHSFPEEYTKSSVIGQLFYQISNFKAALKYHRKAFDLSTKSERGQGASLSNIGLIYHDLKQYEMALENHQKANKIFYKIGFHYGLAASYTNMGYAYIYIPNKIKSILNLKKSLQVSRKMSFRENKKCESDALCNLGLLYEKNEEYNSALYYYFETLEIDKLGNPHGESQLLSDIGRVYLFLKEYKKSLYYFKKSFSIATKLGAISVIKYSEMQIQKITDILLREKH